MDERDVFVENFSENFNLIRNKNEIEMRLEKRNRILEEFSENGIIDLFLARKNRYIFRENGLTSEESADLSKLAKESYIAIQRAALYDLNNPIEAQQWLNTIAPYLNNYNINLESYLHSGIPEITNPLQSILKELEDKNYNALKNNPTTEQEIEHNKIVNAYNLLKKFNFSTSDKGVIDRQLEIIKPYISDKATIDSMLKVDNYQLAQAKIKKYHSSLLKSGVTNTVLAILEDHNYNRPEETVYTNNKVKPHEVENPTIGMTEIQLEHNLVNSMYEEIRDYGFLTESLKEQLDKQEILLNKVMGLEEVQQYIDRMEIRTNNSSFNGSELQKNDIDDITSTKKTALPAFIERFINKFSKKTSTPNNVVDEESQIKQKLEELNIANYDMFAYQLTELKKYINNPNKPLNLSDGTNVIEVILNKADKAGITSKSAQELINENEKSNPVLIHYIKNQIEDLIVHGCFLTSYCNDLIKKNGINLDTFRQEQPVEADDLQLPAIRIDIKEFLESVIQPSDDQKENDVKVMKKTMEQEKKIMDNLNEEVMKKENTENPVINTQVNLNMSRLIKEINQPGMFQTDEERSVIQELWTITNNSSEEKINEINDKINKLYPTKTKEIISESWNNFISEIKKEEPTKSQSEIIPEKSETITEDIMKQVENPQQQLEREIQTISTLSLLDELTNIHNEIIEKTGIDKGIRITEIHDEIESLTSQLETLQADNRSTLDNGLTIIETITKSEIKQNENFDEYMVNITAQKTREISELSEQARKLITDKNAMIEPVIEEFKSNFQEHRKTRDKIRKRKQPDEEALLKEKECAQTYQQIRSYYEQIQKLVSPKKSDDKSKIEVHDNTNLSQLETIISEAKGLITEVTVEKGYSEDEIKNLSKMHELMSLEAEIFKTKSQAQRSYSELLELKNNYQSKNSEIEIIQEKIKKLQIEEETLSFDPKTSRTELENLISEKASDETIKQKLDEYIMPIISFNQEEENRLIEEIEALENKLANRENYLDESKIQLETEKRDNVNKQIEYKTERIEELKELLDNQNHLLLLENNKNILLSQQTSYEEERQILLLWNVEESESNQATRTVLEELFEESKKNLESIQIEIKDCESQIAELKNPAIDIEKVTAEIAKLEEQKSKLVARSEKMTIQLEKKTSTKYMNKELILSDTEELARKKQELEKIRNIDFDKVKEQFLISYNREKDAPVQVKNSEVEEKNSTLELPGMLENGNELKADGTIIDNSQPLPLPGVLENGDVLKSDWSVDSSELNDEEIESITDASPSLLEKAKNVLSKTKDKALAWIKKHPKIAAAIGAAITVIAIGTTIIVKTLSGEQVDKFEDVSLPKDAIETVTDDIIANATETVDAVDKAISEMEKEQETEESKNSFETSYESAVENILDGNSNVYISADRAINDQGALGINDLYTPSFENADVGAIYKQEEGKLIKVSLEEAQNIVENGGQVSVAIENEGTGIGYIAIGDNEMVEENTTGMSK